VCKITGEVEGLTPGLHGFHVHQFGDGTNGRVLRASSYEPGNCAGSVTGTNFVVCSYGKFQRGRLG